jgi:hypothetical protein
VVLYAIWALPETILIRHICLISGALLSLYVIYQYRWNFFSQRAIPVWLILALFAWITFHLIFLSQNISAQYTEYTSIWKRTAIGAVFGLGFGIILRNMQVRFKNKNFPFWVFYLSFLVPTLIYSLKYYLTHYGLQVDWEVPYYWRLYPSSPPSPYYLPKTVYICFCLPALAISLGLLGENIRSQKYFIPTNAIYLFNVLFVIFVFYKENIKNGLILSFLLAIVLIMTTMYSRLKSFSRRKLIIICLIFFIIVFFSLNILDKQFIWQNFLADFRISTATEKFTQWKYGNNLVYPLNELGFKPGISFYERVAWFKEGTKLILIVPFGYGLVEQSFGQLAAQIWPDSSLTQAHSGWLDLTLGIGIPGVALVICAIIAALILLINDYQGLKGADNSNKISLSLCLTIFIWLLLSHILMWVISELSQRVFFDALIFSIAISAGFVLKYKSRIDR